MINIRALARNQYASIAIPFIVLSILLLGGSTTLAGNSREDKADSPLQIPIMGRTAVDGTDDQQRDPSSDPCDLEAVECEGTQAPDAGSAKQMSVVLGYDISYYAIVTAYTSSPEECDDTPCIAADGSDICKRFAAGESICATNDWPFGTILFLGGDVAMTCTVADRMNRRYTGTGRVDIYLGYDLEAARLFGLHKNVPIAKLPNQ